MSTARESHIRRDASSRTLRNDARDVRLLRKKGKFSKRRRVGARVAEFRDELLLLEKDGRRSGFEARMALGRVRIVYSPRNQALLDEIAEEGESREALLHKLLRKEKRRREREAATKRGSAPKVRSRTK